MIRRPPRSTQSRSSAASDVYKRQGTGLLYGRWHRRGHREGEEARRRQLMAGTPLSLVVISPESLVFEGEVDSVVAPAWDGELGILSGHAPLLSLLGSGDLRVTHGGSTEHFHVEGGF